MIIDVLVTDQLNLFIVFYETYGQPERRLCRLVVPYMAPGPSVQFFLISGSSFVISLACGMEPSAIILLVFHSRPVRTMGSPSVGGHPNVHLCCCHYRGSNPSHRNLNKCQCRIPEVSWRSLRMLIGSGSSLKPDFLRALSLTMA